MNDAPVKHGAGRADRAGRYPAAHRRVVGRQRGQPDAHRDAVRPNGSVAIVPGLALLAGNLSDTVTISGTLAEVNLALASVYYLGDPDFFGPEP